MPTYRPTNAGLQTKGTLWAGFDPSTSALIAGVFMASVMVTFATISALKLSWLIAVPLFFVAPNAVLLATVFFLIMGKPPRYLRDWAESRILGRTEFALVSLGRLEPPDTGE
jgi:hypothetical protein